MENIWTLTADQWQEMSGDEQELINLQKLLLAGEEIVVRDRAGIICGHLVLSETRYS